MNGAGAADKASPKMQALLNYIMNQGATDDFTRRIESIVQNAIKHDDWRVEYMTLLERDRQNWKQGKADGIIEGKEETIIECVGEGMLTIEYAMKKLGMTREEVCQALSDHNYPISS